MSTGPTLSRTTISITPDHPALPGHFPGDPVVPGVVILDAVRRAAEPSIGPGLGITAMPQVKFVSPLLPGQLATVNLELHGARLQFVVSHAGNVIASGTFELGKVRTS